MTLERSSDKHGPILDDEMKEEMLGQLRANGPTRSEPWHDPEPIEDDTAPDEDAVIRSRRAEEAGRTRPNRVSV